jgi:hypothetical protein
MRRLAIGGIAAAALFVLAPPASASFDSHFTVVSKTVESSDRGGVFRFHDQLLQIANRDNQVGNLRGRCREQRRKFRCKILAHLNGEVGGAGFLRINGNLGPGDDRLNVVGGTGDFAGVAGKAVLDEAGTGPRAAKVELSLVR